MRRGRHKGGKEIRSDRVPGGLEFQKGSLGRWFLSKDVKGSEGATGVNIWRKGSWLKEQQLQMAQWNGSRSEY